MSCIHNSLGKLSLFWYLNGFAATKIPRTHTIFLSGHSIFLLRYLDDQAQDNEYYSSGISAVGSEVGYSYMLDPLRFELGGPISVTYTV
jgi:hypothetical protein